MPKIVLLSDDAIAHLRKIVSHQLDASYGDQRPGAIAKRIAGIEFLTAVGFASDADPLTPAESTLVEQIGLRQESLVDGLREVEDALSEGQENVTGTDDLDVEGADQTTWHDPLVFVRGLMASSGIRTKKG